MQKRKSRFIGARIFFLILFIVLFFSSKISFAQTSSSAGFVPANIWYSKDPFEEGDMIKIYTLIFNPDKRELSGSVLFFDNDVLLGKKSFLTPGNNVSESNITWQATAGEHLIYAKIENTKFLISVGKYEDVYIENNESDKSRRTVEKKTILAVPISTEDKNKTESSTSDSAFNSISDIGTTIGEKAPDFVSKYLIGTASGLENIRENADAQLSAKEVEVQKHLTEAPTNNKLKKPLEYVELFFLKIFSFILGYPIVCYSLLALFTFFILRALWRKFF